MIAEHELRAKVSHGMLKPVYLLVGNDPYLTKRYANLIAKTRKNIAISANLWYHALDFQKRQEFPYDSQ